jgi:hypothetical protein
MKKNQLMSFNSRTVLWSIAISFTLFISACGSVKPYFADEYKNWQSIEQPTNKPAYTFYLIGDAGKPNLEIHEPSLKLLNTHLKGADENSMVVFLGDNIYEEGMPALNHENRAVSEARIYESVKAVEGFAGSVLFIPGNHDWYAANDSLTDGPKYEREYLAEKLGSENVFLPKDGKPGPAVLQVDDNVVLVVLDSYRWVRDLPDPKDKKKNPDMAEPSFQQELREVLKAHEGKRIVMVMHHPLFTNGSHGGYSSFADHMFPLRLINKKIWFPLPVLGSVLPFARKFGGVIEDTPHKRYKQYRNVVLDASKDNKDLVFAAGHEHSLQFFQKHSKHFVVSGAGSKSSWVRKGKGAAFNHISKGFSKLDIYENGEMWITYIEPVGDGSQGTVVFRWKLAGEQATN